MGDVDTSDVVGLPFLAVGDAALQVLTTWRRALEAQGLSAATIRLYSYGVFRFLFDGGIRSLDDVTVEDVESFLAGLGHRATSKVHYARGLRSFFAHCVRRGVMESNPALEVRVRKPHRAAPVALDEDELVRLLIAAAWRSPRRAWTLMLVFGIGARRMEAAAIRPEDVEGDVVHLVDCKYGKQRRVELSDYARVALQELRPWWNGTVLGGISKQTITEWAHQAAVDAGLEAKVRQRPAHILRASFASHLLRQGVPVQVVRDLMGHESIATTNEYAAVFDGEKDAAVRRLRFR